MQSIELYYSHPVQVRYQKNGEYFGGIAYHDYLIEGCNGQILPLSLFKGETQKEQDSLICELDWVDLSRKII